VGDEIWDVYFAKLRIGRFDERDLLLMGTLGTHYRCGKRGDRVPPDGSSYPNGDLHPSHSPADYI
jgi:hypothetical protein